MKERQFIKQSAKKWKNFEQDIKGSNQNPKKTSKLFIQITDDLSYARTFYPNRMVRKYLDGVSQVLLHRITKAERSTFNNFLSFWFKTLPLALYHSKRLLTISAILFLSAMLLGVVSSMYEPEFAQIILGEDYVNMTESNIESDDPMAVYKDFNAFDGFLGITINNIRVALITFMTGVLYAVGSIIVLIYNGIMVGAFQYFFIERGLFWESFLTIWQHGTLEISAIIIAGGAGITMGRGLIYPKFYSRLQSFKISGRQGLIIFLGTVPLFIIAGFIEGFLTRATDMSPILRLSVIIISLFFILYYYSWYPRFVYKNTESLPEDDYVPAEKRMDAILERHTIYSANDLLRSLYAFSSSRSGFIWFGIITSAILSMLIVNFVDWSFVIESTVNYDSNQTYFAFLWAPNRSVLLTGIISACILFLSMLAHYWVDKKRLGFLGYFSFAKLIMAASFFLLLLDSMFWLAVIVIYITVSQLASNSTLKPKEDFKPPSLGDYFAGSITILGMVLLVNGVFLGCFLIFENLLFSDLASFFTEDHVMQVKLNCGVSYFFWILYFFCSHFMISAGNYYIFHSENEKKNAEGLLNRIQEFKIKYGLKID